MRTPKELIDELTDAGVRKADIARESGLSRSFVTELSQGVSEKLSYDRMERLVAAHRKLMLMAKRRKLPLKRRPVFNPYFD